jgi:phosphonate transport system substrate-binding protein
MKLTPRPGRRTPTMVRTAALGWLALAIVALLSPPPAAGADKPTLEIGLVPNVSARTLLAAYQPMRAFLEQRLGQPVQLFTAPDFKTFYQRTARAEYDVVVTPAHFARLAQTEAGYVPLTTYRRNLSALLVVAQDSPIKNISDLRGKSVAIVDPLAIVTMRGLQWFREQGLQPNVDFAVHISAPHNTAVRAVMHGDMDAAIIGSGPYRIMPSELRTGTRILAILGSVPNATFLASPKLPAGAAERIRAALLAFAEQSPEGRKFIADYGYEGMLPVSPEALGAMDGYAAEVKKRLETTN